MFASVVASIADGGRDTAWLMAVSALRFKVFVNPAVGRLYRKTSVNSFAAERGTIMGFWCTTTRSVVSSPQCSRPGRLEAGWRFAFSSGGGVLVIWILFIVFQRTTEDVGLRRSNSIVTTQPVIDPELAPANEAEGRGIYWRSAPQQDGVVASRRLFPDQAYAYLLLYWRPSSSMTCWGTGTAASGYLGACSILRPLGHFDRRFRL